MGLSTLATAALGGYCVIPIQAKNVGTGMSPAVPRKSHQIANRPKYHNDVCCRTSLEPSRHIVNLGKTLPNQQFSSLSEHLLLRQISTAGATSCIIAQSTKQYVAYVNGEMLVDLAAKLDDIIQRLPTVIIFIGMGQLDKSKYFYRTAIFAKLKDKVMLVDLNDPEKDVPPLESWLGLVVSLADGQHTIQQLLDYLADQYNDKKPDSLEKTIESVFERLIKGEVIKLADEAYNLPYYLSRSADKLDIDMAKQSMADDGYQQKLHS